MTRLVHALFVGASFLTCCFAQTPTLKVLPWNGERAAVSLTFDDTRPVQLDLAVPELNKRHLHATFFVTISKLTRIDDWRKVQEQGHEIGNHSVSHEHPSDLNKEGEEKQIEDAKKFLDSNFHADIITFAYPYMEISPGLLFWVKKYNFAARGWPQDPDLLYVRADRDPDWYNLPAQPAFTTYDDNVYKGWIDRAISLSAWTTFQFHGIGDPSTGWEPIPTSTFVHLLDCLTDEQAKGLWVAPFGTIAAYLRAQKILEEVRPEISNGETRFTWDLPSPFPHGVMLKVRLGGEPHSRLYQGRHKLHATRNGVYSVSFDSRELVVRGES